MRTNSPKQTEASRANGSRSKGPKSAWGKNQVRHNALSFGLSSKDIIVDSAGERPEDFEALKARMWDFFNPVDSLEEMLVTDIVENYWRRRRVRRCETAELNNKFRAQEIREGLERAARLETVRFEFSRSLRVLLRTADQGLYWDDGPREELASSSLGMDELIMWMFDVEEQVTADGYMSKRSDEIMEACGINHPTRWHCRLISSWAEKELRETPEGEVRDESISANQEAADTDQCTIKNEKPKQRRRKPQQSKELLKQIRKVIASLEERQRTLESVEQMEASARAAEALLPADSVDRFSRAETAFERRMYRALGALLSLRGAAGSGMKLPELPR